MSTSTSTVAPGRRRATATASSGRAMPCQHDTTGARRATLLRWILPRKCQRAGPATAALSRSSSA